MTETLILPVGESLGPIVGDDGSVKYRLHSGLELVELDEDTHGMWRVAHSLPGDKTAFWGPRQALELAHESNVRHPEAGQAGGAGIGADPADHPGRRRSVHLSAPHRGAGGGPGTERRPGGLLGDRAGEVMLALATPDAANMFVYGPLFETIWEVARAVVSVSPTQVPAEVAHITKDRMIVERFLMEAPVLLSVGAMHFKRAQRPVGEGR